MDILGLDWTQITANLIKLLIAFVLALPIAWERERANRIMGLRTFPLVAVASCGYVLLALPVVGSDTGAKARIIQGLITGIGFIGGGAILKQDHYVRGTATATSIWLTGAVGAAVAFGQYEVAVVTGVLNYLVLRFMTPVKHEIDAAGEPAEGEPE